MTYNKDHPDFEIYKRKFFEICEKYDKEYDDWIAEHGIPKGLDGYPCYIDKQKKLALRELRHQYSHIITYSEYDIERLKAIGDEQFT